LVRESLHLTLERSQYVLRIAAVLLVYKLRQE